jgi:hypothetical protein
MLFLQTGISTAFVDNEFENIRYQDNDNDHEGFPRNLLPRKIMITKTFNKLVTNS